MGTSVSGISSGAYMATQYQVAFSDEVVGVGIVAGGPYWCAQGYVTNAVTTCMTIPSGIILSTLESKASSWASSGSIASLSNLKNHRAYIFSGTQDRTVYPGVVEKLKTMYEDWGLASIVSDFSTGAGHSFPTDDFGNPCGTTASPYITNCNYDGAGKILETIYGKLRPRVQPIAGNLKKMDISKFTGGSSPGSIGMDATMYYYSPQYCNGNCTVHLALHGCAMTYADIQLAFVNGAGYNPWAEANAMVILYPFTVKSFFLPSNPNGCWDWWGYNSANYAVQSGYQTSTLRRIVKHFEAPH